MSSRSLLSLTHIELDFLLLMKDRVSRETVLGINLSTVDKIVSRLLTDSSNESKSLSISRSVW